MNTKQYLCSTVDSQFTAPSIYTSVKSISRDFIIRVDKISYTRRYGDLIIIFGGLVFNS